jgi:glutamate synthase domain-containing protein 3
MSGGFAYVLDDLGDFADKRCNLTSVDLVPVGEDEEMVRALIEKHVATTASPRGQWVLENWPQMLPKFLKVYPRDLRALAVAAPKEAVHA